MPGQKTDGDFDFTKWLEDRALRKCDPATRGIWMDVICYMRENGRTGEVGGFINDLAALAEGTTPAQMRAAIDDLRLRNAADVIERGEGRNAFVTLVNRRMKREFENRKSCLIRVHRHRDKKRNGDCNGFVTPSVTLLKHSAPPTSPASPPPLLSPPYTLSLIPTTPPPSPPPDSPPKIRIGVWAEEIYREYPRKVGKQDALRAIERAIIRGRGLDPPRDEAWLLARVKSYAASLAGNAGNFTPHCATWMNRGSYDDADAEWNRDEPRKGQSGNKPTPPAIRENLTV